MIYKIRPTTKFERDLKRIQKRGYDMTLLTEVIKNWQLEKSCQKKTEITD